MLRASTMALSILATLIIALPISSPASAQDKVPTFDEIAPIIRAKCVTCHREDGDAPFALEAFEQVRRRATLIRQLTASGDMPPWKPSAESVAFLGDRRLSEKEKSLIARWVDAGTPRGAAGPALPSEATSAWTWGTPDVIIALPDYLLPASGADVFRNFVVAVPFTGTRYVQAFHFRPRTSAVHHANIRVDRTTASAQLDAADPSPGYEGVILHSAQYPEGHFLGWTPGQAAPPATGLAWPLTGGSYLVIQLHMQSTGRPEPVRPLLGLYFAAGPPAKTPTMIRLGRQDLEIRAGDRRYQSVDEFVTPVPITVTAVQPHSHQRARDVSLRARLPDGSRRTLLNISDWDFRWQNHYRLATPFRLPAGTTLESIFHFDNSDDNPRNPTIPAQSVAWGWRTGDEMADVWVQVLPDSPTEGKQLTRLAREKATAEDAIGAEILVAREPAHFNLRNDAALIYLELKRPERALEHFAAARRLKPELPSTAFNVGVALEALGRADEAATAYSDAITIDANYAPGHLRLAALRYRQGLLSEAIERFTHALRIEPRNAAARCDLAKALLESGQPRAALSAYQSGLLFEPDHPTCLINFTWLLAAHDDAAIRGARPAIEIGERAVDACRGTELEPLALDALAAAYANAGRFGDAVRVAESATALTADADLRRDLQQRAGLYRRGSPFRVATVRRQ